MSHTASDKHHTTFDVCNCPKIDTILQSLDFCILALYTSILLFSFHNQVFTTFFTSKNASHLNDP